MNALVDYLMNPPFMQDPPVKLNINAKTLGLIGFILSLIFGVIGLFALIALLLVLGALSVYAGRYALGTFAIFLGLILTAIGTVTWVMTMIGSWRMYQLKPEGKRLVVLALAINVVVSVINVIGSGGLGGVVVNVVIAFVLYYLVLISRFPGETPVTATAGPTTGSTSGYMPPPTQAPPPPVAPPPAPEPQATGAEHPESTSGEAPERPVEGGGPS